LTQQGHQESAFATGDNVKKQAQYFKSIGAKTKAIIIVQGNETKDMVNFFKNVTSRLSPEDYEHIGGIAMADTCTGNGELESIEMLCAAKEISELKGIHENVKKHLHVLGVGSIYRMRPILYLLKSGYLDKFQRISYDSSSHTSTFQYGLLKVDGTCTSIGSYRTPEVDKHFRNVYNTFGDMFSQYITEDHWMELIFGDGEGDWKYSTIKNRVIDLYEKGELDAGSLSAVLLCNAAHTYFQIHNFVTNLDEVCHDEFGVYSNEGSDAEVRKRRNINALLGVKNDGDMEKWITQNKTGVKTKRITRDENLVDMEAFFA